MARRKAKKEQRFTKITLNCTDKLGARNIPIKRNRAPPSFLKYFEEKCSINKLFISEIETIS